ncbi:type I restriction enzyme methylase [Staphylococcus aureus]|nr:type I restriction enzyme methylase [Staphylococcus aureus]
MKDASGYSFYNTSLYTFETLLADPANIESNFRAYLNGFSENTQDILDNFKFDVEITTMADNDALFYVIQEFNKADAYLGPDKMTSTDMDTCSRSLCENFRKAITRKQEHTSRVEISFIS